MKRSIFITIALLCLSQAFGAAITDDNTNGVDRYAVYIGSNKGGKGREQLLYAGSDAQNFQKAMAEIGGVSETNSYILIDPSKEKIDETLDTISHQIQTSQGHAKRSEFIFYYSGHSDETALLLGDTPYEYSELKAAITEVPSDIHVVILDSCYSGNFIRTKGGQKRKPFLIDDSSVVTGHAYLSSSSTNEYSQESDEIESSYFTNAMITGLRGAADASGDNKVTLNELYSYAFNDTLSKTESSKAGPQHPNYNITLVGSGDLVLSDISNGEAMLSLSKEAKGKFIIRNAEGKLISEINKVAGQPIFMALPAAQYSAIIIDEYSTKQGYFILEKDQIYVLDQNSLSTIKRKTNRVRGGNVEKYTDEDDGEILPIDDLEDTTVTGRGSRRRYAETPDSLPELEESTPVKEQDSNDDISFYNSFNPKEMTYFHLSVFPGVNLVDGWKQYSLVSVGILGALDTNVFALQYSSLMNITTNRVNGLQLSGIFNEAGSVNGVQTTGLFNISGNVNGGQIAGLFNTGATVNGVQTAGLFNAAKDLHGVQVAGFLNSANKVHGVQTAGVINVAKEVTGIQVGVINVAESSDGIAIGVINIIKDGMHHLGFNWDSNDMCDIFFQTGTKNLFITLGFAESRDLMFRASDQDHDGPFILYGGWGTEFRFGFSSLDLEFLFKNVLHKDIIAAMKEEGEDFNYAQILIPSFRLTFNALSLKRFDLGIGASFDIHDYGRNDLAFDYTTHRLTCDDEGSTTIHPAVFVGFKIK